jgi:flagellar FliJ protein
MYAAVLTDARTWHVMRNEALLKLRRFEANEKRQKVVDIEMMIADFRRMAEDLDHQIKVEQEACGIHDVNHFAYPTYAKAAIQRRDNLRSSVSGLEAKLEEAKSQLQEALEELKKSEIVEERSMGGHGERPVLQSPPAPKPDVTLGFTRGNA